MTICGYLGMALLSGRLVLTTTSASSASTKAIAVSSTKVSLSLSTCIHIYKYCNLQSVQFAWWVCCYQAVRTIEGRLSIQEEESHWNPQKEKSVYIASPDKKHNVNYLGPASIEGIANTAEATFFQNTAIPNLPIIYKQIVQAQGPSGPNQ
ncbi:hypothetical protein DVH24_042746 [Malus domestica]|uniref:Uncharacterized protein n=1 Tax=Malus domestica TaxID=3750 RepID=A0A498HZ93_MALDO|nr:hypothetical protein DVH24_042746 [Malus domestica]